MKDSRGLPVGLSWRFVGPIALISIALAVWAQTNNAPTLTGAGSVSVRPDRSATVTLSATDVDSDPDDSTQSEPVQLQATAPSGAPAWLDDSGWSVSAQPNPQLSITVSPPGDAQPAQYTVTALATDSRGLSATGQVQIGVLAPLCTAAVEVDDGTGTCVACADHHIPNQSKTACVPCAEDTERPADATACTACAAGSSSPGGSACAANQAPTANAGPDQTVDTGASVTLYGSASSDPEGDALTYAWEQIAGTTVALQNATGLSPTFTAPAAPDTLTFRLTVTDTAGNSGTDNVTVTVSQPALSVSLSASPGSVCDGESSNLSWNSTGADALTLSPSLSCTVTANEEGSCDVTPTGATTWTATATAGTETQTASAMVSITSPSQPSEPRNLRQTGSTSDSVTFVWDAPTNLGACGGEMYYQVQQFSAAGCKDRKSTLSTSATNWTAGGLTPGTHWFRVRARNSEGRARTACFAAETSTVNQAPVANAGADQTVAETANVTLDGSASTDGDGNALTYAWMQTAGATVSLSDATAAQPTFTAPNLKSDGSLIFSLVVNDGTTNSAADTVKITVTADNDAPTANAGPDQSASEEGVVILSGGGTDPEGVTLTFVWTQTSGPAVTLQDPSSASQLRFVAPNRKADYDLTFTLTVNDGVQDSAADTVRVSVSAEDQSPKAEAGARQSVVFGELVTLDGSGSFDPDGELLTYEWVQYSGQTVTLTGADTARPTFTAPSAPPSYLHFTLRVSDGVHTRSDSMTVRVRSPLSVALSASPTAVCDGESSNLSWKPTGADTLTLSPPISCAVLAHKDGSCEVTPTEATTWTATATKTAGTETATASATVSIASPSKPGAPQNVRQTGSTADSVTISWDPPANPGACGGELRYRVKRFSQAGCSGNSATGIATTDTSWTWKRIALGTHWMRVRARNSEGGAWSACFAAEVVASPSPVANAGTDQTVFETSTVTLDGSASSDPDGDALTYSWTQTAGVTVSLSDATAEQPTFTAPNFKSDQSLTFSLVVNDGFTDSAADTVKITVTADDDAPIANAGADRSSREEWILTLIGSGTDPEGEPLTYVWKQTSGPAVTLQDPLSVSQLKFLMPNRAADYDLAFSLTVNDGVQDSAADTVTVSVVAENQAPWARVGATQSVVFGELVTLDGSDSFDPDGELLTYDWVQNFGETVTLTGADTAKPTFTAPSTPGRLAFSLSVSDGVHTRVASAKVDVKAPLSVVLSASPTAICDGESSNLTWNSTGADALTLSPPVGCTVTANEEGSCDVSPTGATTWTATATAGAETKTANTTVAITSPSKPSAPRNFRQTSSTANSVTIAWDAPMDLGACGGEFDYQVVHFSAAGCSGLDRKSTNKTTATSWTAGGLTPGTHSFRVRARNNVGRTQSVCLAVETMAPNQAPVANAGVDQTVAETATATLNGSASTDADGDTLTYAWTQSSGTTVTLSDATAEQPTFTAPNLKSDEDLTFSLVVNDGTVDSAPATVKVTVSAVDDAPTVDAGLDQSVVAGSLVTLSGNGTDPEGGLLSYLWTQTGGTAVTLSDETNKSTTFTAPPHADSLTFELKVEDDGDNLAIDVVAVTVTALPQATLALAASSIAENGGNTTVSASLDLAVASAFTVTIATDSDAVTLGDNAQLSVAAGSTTSTGTVTLSAVDDTLYTGDRTVMVSGALSPGAQAIAPADVALTVTDDDANTTPDFGTLTIADHNWPKDVEIAPLTLPVATGGNGALAYSLSPGLPAGLNFDATTRTVSGTPTASQALALYTYTVTDADGSTASLTFNLVVGYWQLTVSPVPTNGAVSGTVGAETVIDCGTDCAATLADGAAVALTATPASGYDFSAWGGVCAGTTGAACSLSLDADKTVSATFAPAAVDGVCNETVVDGCAAGTLNTTVFNDDDSHHNWRCDGINGGANSSMCSKPKAACSADTPVWTVGAFSCRAPVTGANSGETRTATDNSGTYTGTATFKCDDAAWIEQLGSTCDQ